MSKWLNLTGKLYGRLKITTYIGKNKHQQSVWAWICSCGNTGTSVISNIRSGHTKSCGCIQIKHGESNKNRTPEYQSWDHMLRRCYNSKIDCWENYGGRGIRVCKRWKNSFVNFLNDMGRRPSLQYTLDRINVNGNYAPENCRWATWKQQARNKRGI